MKILFLLLLVTFYGCGHIQIGLVVINTPALVSVESEDEVEVETEIGSKKSLVGEAVL